MTAKPDAFVEKQVLRAIEVIAQSESVLVVGITEEEKGTNGQVVLFSKTDDARNVLPVLMATTLDALATAIRELVLEDTMAVERTVDVEHERTRKH